MIDTTNVDERKAERKLPTVNYIHQRMAEHSKGVFDIRQLDAEFPSEIEKCLNACDDVLRMNVCTMQLLLWGLSPPQSMKTGSHNPKALRRLEHVWKKRGQNSILQIPFRESASIVGEQSHGTTIVLNALQTVCTRQDNSGSGKKRVNHLEWILSTDGVLAMSEVLLNSFLIHGRLLDKRISLGRGTSVIHPFLIAWTQRNVIVDKIDPEILRLLMSNFEALTKNMQIRANFTAQEPDIASICRHGELQLFKSQILSHML